MGNLRLRMASAALLSVHSQTSAFHPKSSTASPNPQHSPSPSRSALPLQNSVLSLFRVLLQCVNIPPPVDFRDRPLTQSVSTTFTLSPSSFFTVLPQTFFAIDMAPVDPLDIAPVHDCRFPIGLQELFQAPLGFLRSFVFARIRLDPLSGQILHHDCISMIVSRFAIVTEDLVICCEQITNIFCTRYGFANAPSARGPCTFGPLADLAISVKGVSTLWIPKSALLARVSSKNGS